ncbi:MAG: peptidoglycan-binding protein [Hungatella sp.]|nr:peptidoglycan-binding protein [Hungatella sp.]
MNRKYRWIGKKNRTNADSVMMIAAVFAALILAGCDSAAYRGQIEQPTQPQEVNIITEESGPQEEVLEGLGRITPGGPEYDILKDLPVPETEPAPEYYRIGVAHESVVKLQERLMELGFMDNDEPTEYYGTVTQAAVKSFQRQNHLAQDGIVGPSTWEAIMDPSAKYYATQNGDQGEDIQRIQVRLYELGYLATEDLVTGNFGDKTEEAVKKLQQLNDLDQDGKVGQRTLNLLYSDEIKPNLLAYGDQSEVVLAAQERLKTLGYLTTAPDGAYGLDTSVALKQFQSRNDLVVDGYLGPSTRAVLNSSQAVPNGLSLGDQGDSVERVQQLLSKYGYLSSAHVTGYYGEVTENAVKSFQKNNSLSNDGSVGMQTMAKLTGDNVRRSTGGPATGGSGSSGGKTSGGSSSGVSGGAGTLISIASSKLGCPYVYGAKGPNSFDCSGFVYWCLNQAGVRQSYITSSGWRSVGKYTKITSFNNLQAGDIIVVSGHVGIVAGGGTVIDASSSNGKVVHRSLSSWWRNNFICGWRIFG